LSPRANPELAGDGRDGKAMARARATWSPERGEGEVERVREGVGRVGSVRLNWTRFRPVWSDQWAQGQNSLFRISLNAIIGNKVVGNS
jgi:hypothetical protein